MLGGDIIVYHSRWILRRSPTRSDGSAVFYSEILSPNVTTAAAARVWSSLLCLKLILMVDAAIGSKQVHRYIRIS